MTPAGRFADASQRAWRLLRHDIGRKLTALAFALVLWGILERFVIDDRAVQLEVIKVPTREEADKQRLTTAAVYLVVPDELIVRDSSTQRLTKRVTLHVKGLADDVTNLNMSAVLLFDAGLLGVADEKTIERALDREDFKPRGKPPELTDFRVSPDHLSVTLARRAEADTMLTALNVTTEGSPKPGYFFQESRIVVRPSQVRLTGPASAMAALRDDPKQPRLAPVKIEGRSFTVTQLVGLPQELLDQGVSLLTPNGTVEVSIYIVPEDIGRDVVSVPVIYLNEDVLKERKLRVKSATATLDLRVTGPESELATLPADELARRIRLIYDWKDAALTLTQARPQVQVAKVGLSDSVKVRLLEADDAPIIEYALEPVREGAGP